MTSLMGFVSIVISVNTYTDNEAIFDSHTCGEAFNDETDIKGERTSNTDIQS